MADTLLRLETRFVDDRSPKFAEIAAIDVSDKIDAVAGLTNTPLDELAKLHHKKNYPPCMAQQTATVT